MPRLMNDMMEIEKIGGAQVFKFSAIRIEHLEARATEYTLVTIAIDVTGSTRNFADDLRKCLIIAVESCKKSPRSDNLLLRVIIFSSSLNNGIEEIHGFKPLNEIDPQKYPVFNPNGMTPLYDAVYSTVGATNAYAKKLMSQDFLANGIDFIITDGDDNTSSATMKMIKDEIIRGARKEEIESLIGVIIGINAGEFKHRLDALANETGMKYIDVGDVTKGKLAKLAEFVSQSVSSQSQSLGTGGPSQNIQATI
ncbi:MAG: hypothetical protein HYW34_00175 [Candidatus Brennerbacteria bacterium]|nr:hypothetical protein [Candidatus Brennerbacteria bacterium]